MRDDHDDEINEIPEDIFDNIRINEEVISIENQEDNVSSHSFGIEPLTDQEVDQFREILMAEAPILKKKEALARLAHTGSIGAYNVLLEYNKHPDEKLKFWAEMALQECQFFLISEMDDDAVMCFSGSEYTGNRLRTFILIFTVEDDIEFTESQQKIIETELRQTGKELNCIVENFNFKKNYAGFSVLIPVDVALATFIENGIRNCNEFGNFVYEHYYASSGEFPEEAEIQEIIKIVKGD